jgi:asparagine synthase (glutamine-hydrolysing)
MCGIAGIYNLRGRGLPQFNTADVLASIRHRGPDDEGWFRDDRMFLGVTRLAIIDPECGRQPVADESGRIHLVMNGEIFNYEGLAAELKSRGHVFHSHCDTESALHLVEEKWAGALDRLDGQFAIAAYDAAANRLLLARDRMGISPLFYAEVGDWLVFGSEMKAIFATGLVRPEIDRRSLDAITAFSCVPAPRTVFRGIRQLPPGRYLEVKDGSVVEHTYWDIPFNDDGQYPRKSVRQWAGEFYEVLHGACARQLHADVPVGLYLSGGIDSSSVAAMVAGHEDISRHVFSIGFPEPGFDESRWTEGVAGYLGIKMHMLMYHQRDLARDLRRHLYHGETPLVSTEGVPLMALSKLASREVKVVLTGEGSDESLGGYEYFRWDAARSRLGDSLAAKAFYAIVRMGVRFLMGNRNAIAPTPEDAAYAQELFGFDPSIMAKFLYFRMVRELVYSDEMLARQRRLSDAEFIDLPLDRMRRWDLLNRTLYLSSRILMTNHLLGSHGDRAVMANSVEGRHPFLDRSVQEFLGTVPPAIKTRVFSSKFLLRRAMEGRLPREVIRRRKKMFLAPFGTPFVGEDATDEIRDLLRPERIREFGYFDPEKVGRLVGRMEAVKDEIARDPGDNFRLRRHVIERTVQGMAMNFVVSTQMLEDMVRRGEFCRHAGAAATQPAARITLCDPQP